MTIQKSLLSLAILSATLGLAAGPAQSQSSRMQSIDYADPDTWLCRPDNPRACDVDLTATIVHADGSTEIEHWAPRPDAPIDCFYIYPTVSLDPMPNSDMEAGPEEINVIRGQFARFGSVCRTYAPLYRQITLTALRAGQAGDRSMVPDRELANRDVIEAWNYYLDNYNNGRGVILIGHSQGAGMLSNLVIKEIEGKPIQGQIISAMLLGATAQVPNGQKTGGTFKRMPACESSDQFGCIVSYVSFRSDVLPSANATYGREGRNSTAICTSPAQLVHGHNELHAYMSNSEAEQSSWLSNGTKITTPFIKLPGLLSGECVNEVGHHFLKVTVNADPSDPRTDDISGDVFNADGTPNAAWGLHRIDVALQMGDLLELAERQGKAWLAHDHGR